MIINNARYLISSLRGISMVYQKTCKICKKEFESESRNTLYCCDKCAKRGAKRAAKRRKMKSNFSKEHAAEKSLDKLVQKAYLLSREVATTLIPQKCSCTDPNHVCSGELQVHHINHFVLDTRPQNLRWLCAKAHSELHVREEDCSNLDELKAFLTIKEQEDIRSRNLAKQLQEKQSNSTMSNCHKDGLPSEIRSMS